jgi:hypothetical protein
MRTFIAVMLLTTSALAQEPSEETKIWALKKAYQMNGNSMVGWGSIDLSQEVPGKVIKTVPIVADPSPPVEPAFKKKKHK